jgi:hypothetical protein
MLKYQLYAIIGILGIAEVVRMIMSFIARRTISGLIPIVNAIQGSFKIRWTIIFSIIVTYLIMIAGIWWFGVRNASNPIMAAINGGILGFIVYGVYNATNYTVFDKWTMLYSYGDVIWGTSLFAAAAFVAKLL